MMRKYHVRFGGGPTEKVREIGTSPAAYPTCAALAQEEIPTTGRQGPEENPGVTGPT